MATTKAAAKEAAPKRPAAKKSSAKKIPARKASAKDAPAKEAAAKKPSAASKAPVSKAAGKTATKAPAKKPAAKAAPKKSSKSSPDDYTNPDLREKLKAQIIAGDKGGRAGQWSARKAQMLAHEYEAEGGGYKHPRNETQQSLKSWGDEHWHTDDGKRAVQGEVTHRYLPDTAWKELSPEQRKATDRKKVAASKTGKQFVSNTEPAAKARKHVTDK